MNATATKTVKIVACACSTVVAFGENGEERRTNCRATTQRTFAPGHDARLKGFLIRAGADNMTVTFEGSGINLDPVGLANSFGFAHMVADGIAAAKKRVFATALRGATAKPKAKAKKAKVIPAPRTEKVACKVGRWTYEGTLSSNGLIFSYTDRKGRHLMAEKFTRV